MKMVQRTTPGSEHEREDLKESAESPSTSKQLTGKKDITDSAREEAIGDIEADAELSIHSPNDDLDESETARLGEGRNALI